MDFQSFFHWISSLPILGQFFHWLVELPHLSAGELTKELVETFLKALGLTELIKFIYRGGFRKRSRLTRKIESLEEELAEQKTLVKKKEVQLKAAEAEIKTTKQRSLDHALGVAEREWQDNNEDSANYALEQWFSANAKSVTDAAFAMAKYHIAHAIPDPADHLAKARNMLQIARAVTPERQDLHNLWHEFDKINAGLQEQIFRDGTQQIGWNANMQREPLIQTFGAAAEYCYSKGQWLLAPLFADRAANLARNAGRAVFFAAETEAAFYQLHAGRLPIALHRLERAILASQDHIPIDDIRMLRARGWHVDMLDDAGRYREALREIDRLIPLASKSLGTRNQEVLAARFSRTKLLNRLGRQADSLIEIDRLARIQREIDGPRSSSSRLIAFVRSQALDDLGRYDEALKTVEEVIEVGTEIDGPDYPNTLIARQSRAEILASVGRHHEALTEYDTTLSMQEALLGSNYPFRVMARAQAARTLARLGHYKEAAEELDATLLVWTKLSGADHPNSDAMRSARIGVGLALNENTDFEGELRSIIKNLIEKKSNSSYSTLISRYRLARLLYAGGRIGEARAELEDSIQQFQPGTSPQHEVLLAMNILLDATKGLSTDRPLLT